MPESKSDLRCPGMIDLTDSEMRRLRHVEERFSELARAWGFEEVRTPLIEHLHLYTSAGTLSPQLLGRVYSFLDWDGWSGERVVLRPDSTVAIARLYGERYAGQQKRLFYAQPVLRFASGDERRETWQVGAEAIGESSIALDVELMVMAATIVAKLGLDETELRISHSGILRVLLARTGWPTSEQSAIYDRILDADRSAVDEMIEALPGLELGMKLLIDSQGQSPEYVANLRAALLGDVPALEEALRELEEASRLLQAAGLPHTITSPLARDFEYYTGLVFQLRRHGEFLGAGGRYDKLVELVAGKSAPASGFALDSEILAGLIDEPVIPATHISLIAEPDATAAAMRLLKALADSGMAGSLNPPRTNGMVVEVTTEAYRRGEMLAPVDDEGATAMVRQLQQETRGGS